MQSPPVLPLACANWAYIGAGGLVCYNPGSATCARCKLVLVSEHSSRIPNKIYFYPNLPYKYCGPECQKTHWPYHKKVCKSALGKPNWLPVWERENREPIFSSEEDIYGPSGLHDWYGASEKGLWGMVPAIDILNLGENEGRGYAEDVSLLFAGTFSSTYIYIYADLS
jgi:hypothetical protein